MLKALYDYGIAHPDVVLPRGYTLRTIKWVACIGVSGDFLGIRPFEVKQVPCPDAGGEAKGLGNVCMEKAGIAIGLDTGVSGKQLETLQKKRDYFLKRFVDSGIPECLSVARMLGDKDVMDTVRAEALALGVKPGDVVGFSVGGTLISDLEAVQEWWEQVCISKESGDPVLDVVTGRMCTPALTYKQLTMKAAGGGQSSGVAMVSHNESAYCSYGLSQNQNCPVHARTAEVFMDALTSLATDAPRIAGMKVLNWYEGSVPSEDDVFVPMFGSFEAELDKDAMKAEADRLAVSVLTGDVPQPLIHHTYHVLVIRPEAARLVVPYYHTGTYDTLYRNMKSWYDGLCLESPDGRGNLKFSTFSSMLYSLLSKSEQAAGDDKYKPVRRLSVSILQSCLTGGALPDGSAMRALSNVRSGMLSGSRDMKPYQWLKLWLCRRESLREGGVVTMSGLNVSHPEPAYHCGRMMAVYADLQHTVNPVMNSTVVDRYYLACSQSPALTIGVLQGLANHHFGKLASKRKRKLYQDALASAYDAVGDVLPRSLTIEGQAYFALGYQQQLSALNKEWREMKGESK